MGLKYNERRYYSDDKENQHFMNYYAEHAYCNHGQPCYHKCYKCLDEKNDEIMSRWYRSQELKFQHFINSLHGFMFISPDPNKINKIQVRSNDKFVTLKKSNSSEELKFEYRRLSKKMHPDKEGGSTAMFQKLSQLYTILLEKFN